VAGERILVIDDSQQIRSALRQVILEPEGYRVLTAADGQAGLALALREHPDLILLDVNMPRMDGLQVLEKLREARYEWPVILMTLHGSENVAVRAFRLGVYDYLRKPFRVEDVLGCVRRALAEGRLKRERDELLKRLEASNRLLQRRVIDLTALAAIGQAVTSVMDLEGVLNRVVEASVYLCRADEGVLYLVDEQSGELYMTAAQSLGEKAAQGLHLRVVDRLAIRVLEAGKPVLLTREVLSNRLRGQTGYLVHSLLSVPLCSRERAIGVLCVVNRVRERDFTRDDMDRLRAIADYAAVAVEKAALINKARNTAIAQMLNNTVVTVSHYVNTPLMALMIKADHLVQARKEGKLVDSQGLVLEMARFAEMKVQEIKAVLTVLRDLASPQVVTYIDNIQMLDIDAKVQERLKRIKTRYEA
jgi:two-component system NtrC family sensor kinase